jgi:hypothetical protein
VEVDHHSHRVCSPLDAQADHKTLNQTKEVLVAVQQGREGLARALNEFRPANGDSKQSRFRPVATTGVVNLARASSADKECLIPVQDEWLVY